MAHASRNEFVNAARAGTLDATILRMKRTTLLLMSALALAPLAQAKEVLPFIQNDFAKALTQAKSSHKPIFVEAWAPW